MDAEARLFGRLCAEPASTPGPARLASLIGHLRALLSTRAGSSLLDASYGLPDLTDLAHAATPHGVEIARLIAACVCRHEPRLRDVSVQAAPMSAEAPTTLGFTLRATLDDGAPLRLAGHLTPGGQLSLIPQAP